MVPLFYHNTFFTKKGGSTSTDTMMDGLDTGKNTIFMLFFTELCAPSDMGKIGEAQQKKKGPKITEVPMELHPHSRIKIRKHEWIAFFSSR